MEVYSIFGGVPLQGDITVGGAKNAILPLLAASVLIPGQIELAGCPDLMDIRNMLLLLRSLGCTAERKGQNLILDSSMAQTHIMPESLSKKMRSSIFMLGPVLARFGQADFTYPGGCEIGLRPIDLHLQGLRALGAQIDESHGHILCRGKLHGSTVHLDYPSVGATENILMAAVCANGDSVIYNAAKEPEIVDLSQFLCKCGAQIRGAGTDIVYVKGGAKLHAANYEPLFDRIAAGTILLAGAATRGDVFARGARAQEMQSLLFKMKETGCQITVYPDGVRARLTRRPRAVRRVETSPYPGFPTDMQAQMMAYLTLAQGTSVVEENVFENRMAHAGELARMGADIQVSGRAAVVRGVEELTGARVTSRDLRGGAALCIAALAAQGQSIIERVDLIDRGHDHLEDSLKILGAKIERMEEA